MENNDFKRVDYLANKVFDELSNNLKSNKVYGLQSGYSDLDVLTQGWNNGELIVISGRPSMGKTAFMISLITNMSIESNIPVGVISLEATYNQLIIKLLSSFCEIDSNKIQSLKLENSEWKKFDVNMQKVLDANIFIDCPPRLKVQDLCEYAKELTEKHAIKALFIDYIQLLTVTSKYSENRYNEINYISRELKALAKALNIPIFAISQMNRNVENNERSGVEGRKPRLTDLRDSGTLCDDADKVCFIFRPECYNITEDEVGNSLIGTAEIILAKNRFGSTGSISLNFKKEFNKFKNIANYIDHNYK